MFWSDCFSVPLSDLLLIDLSWVGSGSAPTLFHTYEHYASSAHWWQRSHPQFLYSVEVSGMVARGTSGKLALAIRRGRILPPMSFHCSKEACWRTYSRKWASECGCLVKEVWVVQTPCCGACRSHPPLWKGLSVPNLCAQSLVKRKLWMTSKIPVSLCEPLGKLKVHKI